MRARCSAAVHERGDARHVALERQALQIEHQLGVIVEPLRHADAGPIVFGQRGLGILRLGLLNAAFDFTQHVEVVGDTSIDPPGPASLEAWPSLQSPSRGCCSSFAPRRAAARPGRRRRTAARRRAAGCSASAGSRRRRPRQRGPVGTAVAGIAAAGHGVGQNRELERRQRRLPADLRRDDLIDRDARRADRTLRFA